MKQWYLVQIRPNAHRMAERNLHRQGFETFIPMKQTTLKKASRFVSDLKPLFPGYMFVNILPETAPWRKINSTYGVSKLVSLAGKPTPLPLQLITELKLRCDAAGMIQTLKNFNTGDRVEILSGPFANFIAIVDTIDPAQRIWLLMDFMGQKSHVQASKSQLQLKK